MLKGRKINLTSIKLGHDQQANTIIMPEIKMIKKTVILPKINLLNDESNQSRITGLVSIGKVAKFLRNAKSHLKYSKLENLNQHQLNLIGDRTYFSPLVSDPSPSQDFQKLGRKVNLMVSTKHLELFYFTAIDIFKK